MSTNQPRQTKAQRRDAARLKAKELREAQARRARRNMIARRSFIGAGGVAVAGGLGYLGYLAATRNQKKFPAAGKGLATEKANQSGVPKQVLADASWTYGDGSQLDTVAASAPVLDIYFDYSCSHCAQFEGTHTQEINQLLSDKKITLALHPCKILKQQWTSVVMNAMGVVLDEAPAQSLSFHGAAFEILSQVLQSKDQSLMTVENLVAAATKVSVPSEVSAKFKSAVDSDKYKNWVELGDKAFADRDLQGTPTVFFKGEQVDLSKLQSPTSLTELVTGSTPTTQPTEQSSQQPAQQPAQQSTEQPAEQQGADEGAEQQG
ncbi:thioredoxin domain-containing protein [Actinomyces viscosus]|uniref:DsbA family protein n=1 Tax=Actinomyces viscosus TaxID=1656 RepID=UPI0028EB9E1B|nr:thioredoxin domain-containing protein [Actinomyces viscosus]